MTPEQDAYGQAIHDYFSGQGGFEIVERDDGWIGNSLGPPAYFSEFDDWPSHERNAMSHVRGRVLDVGCGAGRHSLYLQDRGFDVMATDISPLAIEVCKRRGLTSAMALPLTRIGRALGRFDTILMLGNNFGLFGGHRRARWLLRRFKGITGDGGRIIAESRDPYATDDPEHLAYHELNRRRGRMPGQLRMRIRYKLQATPWFDYLIASKDEMEAVLDGTGWAVNRYLEVEGDPTYVATIEKQG